MVDNSCTRLYNTGITSSGDNNMNEKTKLKVINGYLEILNTLIEVHTNLILEGAEQWQINTIAIQMSYIKDCIKDWTK